jgi:multicomponent Na+:H+ antiporter subunit C
MNVLVASVVAALYGVGVYMILQRSLIRIVLGLSLLSHGANLLLLSSGGSAGIAAFIGRFTGEDTVVDPVPQAFVLTAIVISFSMTAFLLALAYRSWRLTGDDDVLHDDEDARLAESTVPHGGYS